MHRTLYVFICVSALSSSGCVAVAESIIDGLADSIFGDDDDIAPRVLERKGIEPGSDRHKRLVAEERFQREFQEEWEQAD